MSKPSIDLFGRFRGRTADAIECMRRSEKYKTLRERFSAHEFRASQVMPPRGCRRHQETIRRGSREKTTVDNCIGGHVNVLSDYKNT